MKNSRTVMESTLKGILLNLTTKRNIDITESTRIYHDLWISGDDAAKLLQTIHQVFGTDFKGLNLLDYFYEEPWSGVAGFWHRFGGGKVNKKEMTFGQLLRASEVGKWNG